MPALARLPGKRVRSSECLLNYETVSNYHQNELVVAQIANGTVLTHP